MKNIVYHIKHLNNRFLSSALTSWHSYFQSMISSVTWFYGECDLKEKVSWGKQIDESRTCLKVKFIFK